MPVYSTERAPPDFMIVQLTNTIIHNSKAWGKWPLQLHIHTLMKAHTHAYTHDWFVVLQIMPAGEVFAVSVIAHTWTYEYVSYVNTGSQGNGGSAGFANLSLCRLEKAKPSFWCRNKRIGYSYAQPCVCGVWDVALHGTSWWDNSPKTTSVLMWPVNGRVHW